MENTNGTCDHRVIGNSRGGSGSSSRSSRMIMNDKDKNLSHEQLLALQNVYSSKHIARPSLFWSLRVCEVSCL